MIDLSEFTRVLAMPTKSLIQLLFEYANMSCTVAFLQGTLPAVTKWSPQSLSQPLCILGFQSRACAKIAWSAREQKKEGLE